jgi:dienelactone hydrolase
MAQWVANHGFVVYLVPDIHDRRGGPPPWDTGPHHPYALVGRIGNEPRSYKERRHQEQVERIDGSA